MRILVIKISSMGDVIHTLAAIEDACTAIDGLTIDWVVDEAFSAIPSWHPGVDKVYALPLRRFKKERSVAAWKAVYSVLRSLSEATYDMVIDAQGLLKSAWVSRYARGKRVGLSWRSAREPLASVFYHHTVDIAWGQHAVVRLRSLFAQALGYTAVDKPPRYGILRERLHPYPQDLPRGGVVFLHGTTWETKYWDEAAWCHLGQSLAARGLVVLLPAGSLEEQTRAQRIAASIPQAVCLPALSLSQLALLLLDQHMVVGVDTGLGHLCAALGVRAISLYGPTDALQTGTLGEGQVHLQSTLSCSPCLKRSCRIEPQTRGAPPCMRGLSIESILDMVVNRR